MSKWIAEFDLEDGDTMPEHMDLEYKGVKIDFHCRPKEPILDKIDEIITDALDKSTDQKESQTLRWVLDKISEVT